MNSKIKTGVKTDKNTVLNILFGLYVATEVMFGHTVISQACMIAFVVLTFMMCTYNKVKMVFLIPYALIIFWSGCMVLTHNVIDYSNAISLTKTMIVNLVFFTAFTIYYKTVNDVDEILNVFKISALLSCVPILAIGLGSALAGHRLQGTGINSNFLGSFVSTALMILIYQMVKKQGGKLWNFIQIALLSTVMLISGSRSAILLLAICLYVFFVFRKPKRAILNTVIVIIVFAVLLVAIMRIPVLYELIGKRIDVLFQYLSGEEFNDASLNARERYIEVGWQAFLERPYLGYGADTFRTVAGQYAHCNFIELLFSFGIISAVYYIPFLYCIFKLIKHRKRLSNTNKEVLLLAAGIILSILVCDYSRVTYYERIALIPLNIAILTIAYYKPKKELENENSDNHF